MKTLCGCPLGRAAAALFTIALVLFAFAPRGFSGDKNEWTQKVNVHYCKCNDETFCTPADKEPHCPCGMHEGKFCHCGHPHKGLYEVTLATTDGAWKKGEKRTFTVHVKNHGPGADAAKAEAKPIAGAEVEAMLHGRGEMNVCPMKCAESATADECPVCHMKLKKGEGWKPAGAAVKATAKDDVYTFELDGAAAGKALIRVSGKTKDGDNFSADFELEIAG